MGPVDARRPGCGPRTLVSALTLLAEAKLNLGLAVLGGRADGFHDIATIFLTIDLHDTIGMSVPAPEQGAGITRFASSDRSLAGSDNIVVQSVAAMRTRTGCDLPIDIMLEKAIPAAAGLGGASSDAAATLVGLNAQWNLRLTRQELEAIGSELGSDVPFFVSGGCALGLGRGEVLRPLPVPPDQWFIVVFPVLSEPIPRKTATLFATLWESDFQDRSGIDTQSERIAAGRDLDCHLLTNSFARPLYALRPELTLLRDAMLHAGAECAAVSGAGPTHYSTASSRRQAERIKSALQAYYSGEARVFVCRATVRRALPDDDEADQGEDI